MVIKNETVLTGEEVFTFLVKSTKKTFYSKFIFIISIGLIGLFIIISSLLTETTIDSLVIGCIFLFFDLLLLGMNVVGYIRVPKKIKINNQDVTELGMINNFTFKEQSFILAVTIGSRTTKIESEYKELSKIIEKDDRILFMLTNTEAFICKKSGFASLKELELFFYGLDKHKIKIKKKIK